MRVVEGIDPLRVVIYARVSTTSQDLETQIDTLARAAEYSRWKVVGIFKEKVSGRKANRPELYKALDVLRSFDADAIAVSRLSRLGRDANECVLIASELKKRNQHIIAVHDGLDTNTRAGQLIFHILAGLAEFELEEIRSRTQEKIDKLKREGKKLGRPNALDPSTREGLWRSTRLRNLLKENETRIRPRTQKEIAREVGISVRTMQRFISGQAEAGPEEPACSEKSQE